MGAPELSVVIPSVNGLADLTGCLDALEAQRRDVDLEVIALFVGSWSLGELVGYSRGPADSLARVC